MMMMMMMMMIMIMLMIMMTTTMMMVVVLTVSSDICDLNLCLTLALTHLTGRDLIVSLASTVKSHL